MSTSPQLVVADRYRLVAPLGQGGMGRVWRATDVVLHREVAIKELVPPPGLTPDERREMRDRSLREARAIARLNNINVVRVFDVLRTDADPWIVMEYVPSSSLQDTLAATGPLGPVRAAEIGLGVLNALRAAHRAGVVHRDVKPGNVLLGEDGRVVLTDFGLATVPGDPNVTRTGLVLGSPAYIAPERARDGTAGPAADLWSLGATLYAAVEGASPFARPTAIATLAALATENPPPSRNAGPMKPVLNGLLRKDPAHRINAEEAERLLLRATGRRSKLSFPMSPTMRRPGVGRERPALPSTPPVVPGGATGSAPVVPGPRPPASGRVARGQSAPIQGTNPYAASPGPSPESPAARRPSPPSDRPVFAPGKATVGPPQRPDNPTRLDGPKIDAPRLDATRLDTPPVQEPSRRTGEPAPASPVAPTKPEIGESAQRALGPGTRGVFGTISAAEIAHRRHARSTTSDSTSPDDRATVEQAAVAPSQAPADKAPRADDRATLEQATVASQAPAEAAPRADDRATIEQAAVVQEADTAAPAQADDRATLEQPAVERTSIAAAEEPAPAVAEQAALERAAANWRASEGTPSAEESLENVAEASALPGKSEATVVAGKSDEADAESLDETDEAAGAELVTTTGTESGSDDAANVDQGVEEVAPAGGTDDREAAGTAGRVEAEASHGASGGGDSAGAVDEQVPGIAGAASAEPAEVGGGAEAAKVGAGSAEVGAGKAATEVGAKEAAAEVGAGESAAEVGAGAAAAEDGGGAGAAAAKAVPKPTVGARAGAGSSKASRRKGRGKAAAAKAASAHRAQKAEISGASDVDASVGGAVAAEGGVAGSELPTESSATVAPESVADDGIETSGVVGKPVEGKPVEDTLAEVKSADAESAEAEPAARAADKDEAAGNEAAENEAAADLEPTATKDGLSAGLATADEGVAAQPEAVAEAADLDTESDQASDDGATGAEAASAGTASAAALSSATGSNLGSTRKAGAGTQRAGRAGKQGKGADREPADTDPGRTRVVPAKVAALRTNTKRTGVINVPVARESGADETQEKKQVKGGVDAAGTTVLPGFRSPSRPAWTPMAVPPRPGKKGITVFGTTLSRNQTLVAGVVVLVVLLLLIVLIPKAFGGDDNNQGAAPAPTKAAAPAPTKAATTQPQPTTQAPSSAPPASPSSAAASSAAAVTLPAGWVMYKDPTGFQVPIWSGASIQRSGSEVYFRKDNRLLIVDQTDQPKPDPVADWTQQEHDRAGSAYRNYHRIKIVAVNYFVKAADWEFTYTTSSGNDQHADKRGIITSAHQAYGLSWYTSPDDWAASQNDLQLIYQGFQPKS